MVSAVERDKALQIGLKGKDWRKIFDGKSGMNEVYFEIITRTPDEVYRRVITRMVAATVDESNFILTEDGDTGTGSPPHTRGIHHIGFCAALTQRFTPAYAGNTQYVYAKILAH